MAYIGPQFIPGLNHSLIILCYRMSHSAADAWQLPPAPAIFPMFLPCYRTKKRRGVVHLAALSTDIGASVIQGS